MYKVNLGRYSETNSWLHKIDPRVKLIANILFLVALFTAKNLMLLAMLDVVALAVYLSVRADWSYPIKLLKIVIPIFAFVFLIQAWMLPAEGRVYYYTKEFKISDGAFFMAGKVSERLFGMFLIATTFTFTTRPMDITRAIEDLLTPLKWIKFPVHIIATVISIALNWTPMMIDHAKKVGEAQASRGMDLKNSSWFTKMRNIKTIWVPMLAASFVHSIELGNAFDARGYNPYDKRIKYFVYRIKISDIVLLFTIIGIVATVFCVKSYVELPTWWL